MTFTPLHTGIGGLLLHFATSTVLTDCGRVLGISGVLDGALFGQSESWRWSLIAGLVSGPVIAGFTGLSRFFLDTGVQIWSGTSWERLALAGLLVGFGAKLGSGCTSGHMLCGVSRLSKRSIIATATFFTTAVITANVLPSAFSPTPATPSPTNSTPFALGFLTAGTYATINIVSYCGRQIRNPSILSRNLPYFAAGLTFSFGLCISGMVSPTKVQGFLRITSPTAFDPSLAVIMVTGVLPNAIHYLSLQNAKPGKESPEPGYSWEKWNVPNRTQIDWRLVIGAAIFGVGWGLSGVCPGPAMVTLGQLITDSLPGADVGLALRGWVAFAGSMLAGFRLARMV